MGIQATVAGGKTSKGGELVFSEWLLLRHNTTNDEIPERSGTRSFTEKRRFRSGKRSECGNSRFGTIACQDSRKRGGQF